MVSGLGQLLGLGDGGKRLEGDEDAEADGDIFVDHCEFLLKRVGGRENRPPQRICFAPPTGANVWL